MLGTEMLGVLLVDNFFTRTAISAGNRSLIDALATNDQAQQLQEQIVLYNIQHRFCLELLKFPQ